MKTKTWQDTDLAYFAGLFDGEGCIYIEKQKYKEKNTVYSLKCKISMCNFNVLNFTKSLFGGCLYHDKPHHTSNRYGNLWSWSCYCGSAKLFLIAILPFLHIKKTEAELGIKFQERRRRGARKEQQGNTSNTKEEIALDETDYILMKQLKGRDNNVIVARHSNE